MRVNEAESLHTEPVACCAPLAAPSLSDEEAAATAELFKALADPARVRIVNALATADGAVCACDFNEGLGLLEREQRGKWAYFTLKRGAVEKLAAVADLKGVCC
jgi:ArsR family transcriptional regulator, arsenate/arsenite/antimonite-responsive transcriptional repressor